MEPERRAWIEASVQEHLKEMVLAELSKHSGMTQQQQLADALGIKQPSLSKLEKQDDMQLSTLRRLVEALDGELELVVKLPTGSIRLT